MKKGIYSGRFCWDFVRRLVNLHIKTSLKHLFYSHVQTVCPVFRFQATSYPISPDQHIKRNPFFSVAYNSPCLSSGPLLLSPTSTPLILMKRKKTLAAVDTTDSSPNFPSTCLPPNTMIWHITRRFIFEAESIFSFLSVIKHFDPMSLATSISRSLFLHWKL